MTVTTGYILVGFLGQPVQDEHEFSKLRSASDTRLNEKPSSQPEGEVFKNGEFVAEGQYQIVRFLGRGAIGSVFCVEKADSKKLFALKTLNTTISTDTTWRRFQKEIDAASRLDHPNLVKAVDFGLLEDERPFMVMEFVEGITLSDAISSRGRLSTDEVLSIFTPLTDALAYAHREKVVHRDLKPSNIMLQSKEGRVIPKLVDFGIARIASEAGITLTQVADVFGTPLYMSPEQCVSAIVDHRSDIYSLGCVMFETLTGAPPFSGDSSLTTMMKHRSDTPPTLSEASLGVAFSKGWEELIAKMLVKDPAHRIQNCEEVLSRLNRLQSGDIGGSNSEPPEVSASDRTKSSKNALLTGAAICMAISLLLAVCLVIALNVKTTNSGSIISSTTSVSTKSSSSETLSSSATSLSPPASSSAIGATKDDNFAPLYDMKFNGSFHTLVKNGIRYMAFPTDQYYGVLSWWDKDHKVHEVNAIKPLSFPATQKLILDVGEYLIYEDSMPLANFKDGDLNGARIREEKNADKIAGTIIDTNSHLLSTLASLSSLNLLDLDGVKLDRSSYRFLNQMSHLRWFRINQYAYTDELVKLSFIPNLRVLVLVSQKKIEPVIARLSPTNLHSLFLDNCELSEPILVDLGKLHGLKTLASKANLDVDFAVKLLTHARSLRHLERLSFCVGNVQVDDYKKLLTALKLVNFKSVVIVDSSTTGAIPDQFKEQVIKGLEGREIVFLTPGNPFPDAWFNYRYTDPATLGIW